MKALTTLFLYCLAASTLLADTTFQPGLDLIQKAFNTHDEGSYLEARDWFIANADQSTTDSAYINDYYLALINLRLLAFYHSDDSKGAFKEAVNSGIRHAKMCCDRNPEFAESYSLLASLYGQKISLGWLNGMTLGPKSGKALSKAMELDPQNPRIYLLDGMGCYHKPEFVGGGKAKAKQLLTKAVELFETHQPRPSPLPNWGHEQALAWLAKIELETGNSEKAGAHLAKARSINPDYGFIKYLTEKLADSHPTDG
jgi:tetratricopeptide (TPR) repeat protein